jgi:carbon-monoxide dehydrogenase medium subunit
MRFEYFEPSSLEETRELLRRGEGHYKPFAGGTDVILQLRRHMTDTRGLINIKRLPGIGRWSAEPGRGLRIGAAALLSDLEASSVVFKKFPALFESIKVIGSVQLRNIATLGGNLCNASPAADTAPSLLVLGASAAFVANGSDERTLSVESFLTGPGQTVLGPDGLLLRIDVPEPEGATGSSYERLTPRDAMDIAIASAASKVILDANGKIGDISIALGAVAPTPVRAPKAEDLARGCEPTPDLLASAASVAMEECCPIDDIRGSAAYRRAMVGVLVRRTLERAVERARR